MDLFYSLLIYGLLLYFFKIPAPKLQALEYPLNILYGLTFLPLWLHSLLAQSSKKKALYIFLWITVIVIMGKFSIFYSHYSYCYYLEACGYILSNTSLLFYILYLGFLSSSPISSKEEKKKNTDEILYNELLVVLKEDPGFLSIPGISFQSVRNLLRGVYVIPKESFPFLTRDNVEQWCPWYDESKIIEKSLKSLQQELKELKGTLLVFSEENQRAIAKIERLQVRCAELEKTRDQLLKDIQKMRSESRLQHVSDLHRLTNEELEKTKDSRIREIKIIDQILSLRQSAAQENH
ncbi:hypothetical protein [Methylacidiphilum caldifontis]|uniref:hypothetical protein n=1 Tax=Methylacidiphilum caldifontis TaxID=2795386 RepID=UPI001FC9F5ED|nr:hypothetical protein [Methylacidiphilum caldifontis]